MWSLRQKQDGSMYLTYDKFRRFNSGFRGIWELIGPQGNRYTEYCIRVNEGRGLLTCPDDEGHVRVLVLED